MIQILVEVPKGIEHGFEDRLMEMVIPSWTIREDRVRHKLDLIGYFDDEAEGVKSYATILERFPGLPEHPSVSDVADRDWKNAYRDHFQHWSHSGLHWVPAWLRDKYPVPLGEKAIYLDPGMAFGTGNHETTRLCAIRLVEASQEWGDSIAGRSVIDAGCGSGILAISAVKLGFGNVSGFDIDMASVQISRENAEVNGIGGKIDFTDGGLEKCLPGKHADIVLANILANVLMQDADFLLDAVIPGGKLVLSGILATEIDEVKGVFDPKSSYLWGSSVVKSRTDGEWADLMLSRP